MAWDGYESNLDESNKEDDDSDDTPPDEAAELVAVVKTKWAWERVQKQFH